MRTFRFVAACALSAACVLALSSAALAQTPAPQPPQTPTGQAPSSLRPRLPSALRPPAQAPAFSPVDPKLDVRAAIEDAKKRAGTMRARVLVIWMADPEAQYSRSLIDVLNTADIHQRLGLEYTVVWADTGKGEHAAANRELAKSLGADVTPADVHATLTVLTQAGKPVVNRSVIDMVDPVRTNTYTAPTVNQFLGENAEPATLAKTIADNGIAKARESKRCVLLCFGEWGDIWSWKFRTWLASPEAAPVLEKRAVVTNIELLRDKGAFELMEKFGGVHVQSLPWFVVLNSEGKSVGTSQPEKMPNIGFPTDDGEITTFLALLKSGNPDLTDEESKALRDSLVAIRNRKGQ
jgi:hypothetical protein